MLTLTLIASMMITLVFLVFADEKSLMRFPLLHKSTVSPMIRSAFRSDMVLQTIRQIKKMKHFVISSICGFTETGGI